MFASSYHETSLDGRGGELLSFDSLINSSAAFNRCCTLQCAPTAVAPGCQQEFKKKKKQVKLPASVAFTFPPAEHMEDLLRQNIFSLDRSLESWTEL